VLDELPERERVQWLTQGNNNQAGMVSDPTLLKIMMRNLLDNALKYSHKTSGVEVVLVLPDAQGHWSVLVGNLPGKAGWPDQSQLFQKYYRSPAAGYRSGSGLGLYLVSRIARLMGGELRYLSDDSWIRFGLFMRPIESSVMQ
jgi:signal transduction histidine kinase